MYLRTRELAWAASCNIFGFLAVYLLFRLAPFAKNLLKEDEEELFVLLTALRSAGRRRKLARIQGFVEEIGHATVAFLGQLENGSSVINTTEGRELSIDVSARELASTVNNSDPTSPFQFFEAWLPGTAGRARFPAKIIPPKKTHILPIPRKPNSVHSVHSAIGSRMNGIAFRSFRKRNMFQKNAITVNSEYSYSGIVPKEGAL